MARRRKKHSFVILIVAAILIAFTWGYLANDDEAEPKEPPVVDDVNFYIYIYDYQFVQEYDMKIYADGVNILNASTLTTRERSPNQIILPEGNHNFSINAVNNSQTLSSWKILNLVDGFHLIFNLTDNNEVTISLHNKTIKLPTFPERDEYTISSFVITHSLVPFGSDITVYLDGEELFNMTPVRPTQSWGNKDFFKGEYNFTAVFYNNTNNMTLTNTSIVFFDDNFKNETDVMKDTLVIYVLQDRLELHFIAEISDF